MKIHLSFSLYVSVRSGIETRIQNAVFHLLRNKSNGELILQAHQAIKQEPLAYMMKIQVCTTTINNMLPNVDYFYFLLNHIFSIRILFMEYNHHSN